MLEEVFEAPPLPPPSTDSEGEEGAGPRADDAPEPLFEDPFGHLLPAAKLDPDEREVLFAK